MKPAGPVLNERSDAMDNFTSRLFDALEKYCRFATTPVAIKLAKDGDMPPKKSKYPIDDVGNRLAVCQGMSIARTYGWTMAFRKQDHACPLPSVFMGHIKPDIFLKGTVAEFYQDDTDCMRIMESSYPKWPLHRYKEIWLAPVKKCDLCG